MAKSTTQPAPGSEDLKDLVCDHNGFSHHIFPFIVYREGPAVFESLAPGSPRLPLILKDTCAVVERFFTRDKDSVLLHLKDITVTKEELSGGRLLILSLTPPCHPIGTYFIGLFSPASTPSGASPVRYLTFERTSIIIAGEQALLCEWILDEEGNPFHQNHGFAGSPTLESFKEQIARMSALRSSEK